MSYKQMTGNIISATKVEPQGRFNDSPSSGVWSLQEQFDYRKGNNWPINGNGNAQFVFLSGVQTRLANERIDLASTGGTTDFGEIRSGATYNGEFSASAGFGNSTRGIFTGITTNAYTNQIEYFTFASSAETLDFGNLTATTGASAGCSNNTRGIIYAGIRGGSNSNIIDYITIASTGNATDFGDATVSKYNLSSCASPTRGISAGGYNGSTFNNNVIDYITIGSAGNATDFGDLTTGASHFAAAGSATRGVFSARLSDGSPTTYKNVIDYITIGSTGNATDFGDQTQASRVTAAGSGETKTVFAGSGAGGGDRNFIDIITTASTGNAADFGDLSDTAGRGRTAAGNATPSQQPS